MGNTNVATVHNDLPVDVVISTYNGEDIAIFIAGKGKPYETFSVQAGSRTEVKAFGWRKGLYVQMTYRGVDTDPYKTVDGETVRCSALANLSSNPVFQNLLQKQEEVKPKPAPQLPAGRYDVFLSYRKASDREVAQLLYFQLQQRQYPNDASFLPRNLVVFWDETGLLPGENWEEGFLRAIAKSELLVLIISEKGLTRILHAHEEADNVLLEYEYAIKLHEENPRVKLQPIFMQNVEQDADGREIITAFDFRNWLPSKFPNAFHVAPKSPKSYTIQQVMEKIFKLQGIPGPSPRQLPLWGGPTAELVNRLNK